MTLQEFFRQPGAPQQVDIAKRIGMDQSYLGRIIHGARVPGPKWTLKLFKACGKKVTLRELNPELYDFVKQYKP